MANLRRKKYSLRIPWIIAILVITSCNISKQGLFAKKTPHEKYKESLADAGLSGTRLGRLWLAAADKSLAQPIPVSIPYQETGYFEMDAPGAAGYIFSSKQGEQVVVTITTTPGSGILLFLELWEVASKEKPGLLIAADTTTNRLHYEIKKDGQYIVRLQPELLQGLAYTVLIRTTPSLAFPINKVDNPRIISVWGDARDGNTRRHEGIDILAKKYTPVVAAADGRVTSVREGGLGGKVVFLQPKGKDYRLYYAHLDTQMVRSGDQVTAGDTLGLVGNTGNAINTVAHLHFGIYTGTGAVDPLPFVNTSRLSAKSIKADTATIAAYARIKNNGTLFMNSLVSAGSKKIIPTGSLIKILAATDDLYKIYWTGNGEGFVKSFAITTEPLRRHTLQQPRQLFDQPDSTAAVKSQLATGSAVTVLGTYETYYYIKWNQYHGWIKI